MWSTAASTIANNVGKFSGVFKRFREAKSGNQENREVRAHNLAIEAMSYRKRSLAPWLITAFYLPILIMWLVIGTIPIINFWGNVLDPSIRGSFNLIRLFVLDYEKLWVMLGREFIITIIIQAMGIAVAGWQGKKKTESLVRGTLEMQQEEKKMMEEETKNLDKIKEIVKEKKNHNINVNMNFWDEVYAELMVVEGGYVDDPDDRGGETYKGVSRKNFPNWNGWILIDNLKNHENFPRVLNSNSELELAVKVFYYDVFYAELKCPAIAEHSKDVARELFDSAVNAGHKRAVQWLQKAINFCSFGFNIDLKEDGKIGDKTVRALIQLLPKYERQVYKSMNGYQFNHYESIVSRKPSQKKYARGWLVRV